MWDEIELMCSKKILVPFHRCLRLLQATPVLYFRKEFKLVIKKAALQKLVLVRAKEENP